MSIEKETASKIKKIQLELASELHNICLNNDIEYYIVAGSLLGAIRHKGFIPWDDDFDIAMLRKNYEKFMGIASKELDEKYFLQNWYTDENFGLPIAKIRKNNTKYIEGNSKDLNIHQGIFIDIFPLDNKPDNRIDRFKHSKKTYFLKRIILVKQNYILWGNSRIFKKFIYKLISILVIPISTDFLKLQMHKEMTKFNGLKTNCVVGIGGAYNYEKETINRKWIENRILLDFEDQKFFAPLQYDEYLTNLYGDYMTPPPENLKGNRHGIIDVKF